VKIKFDSNEISLREVFQIFFARHDSTNLNRQENDVGSNCRSAISYHSPEQKGIAENVRKKLTDEELFGKPIVTEMTEFEGFYPAEDYHQSYFEDNPNLPYCASATAPQVAKYRQKHLSKRGK
jgi:peptide-methionine (S)-S-oxide reductase